VSYPFICFRYIDEQAFGYNHRKRMNDQARFEAAMKNVFGKRLTYADRALEAPRHTD
jgi:hypothetical protein